MPALSPGHTQSLKILQFHLFKSWEDCCKTYATHSEYNKVLKMDVEIRIGGVTEHLHPIIQTVMQLQPLNV